MTTVIGTRWRPGHVERRDSETGFFEAINSPIDSRAEIEIQRALLWRPETRSRAWVVPCIYLIAACAFAAFIWRI